MLADSYLQPKVCALACPASNRPEPSRRRRGAVVALLLAATVLLFALVFSQSWFNLTFLRPNTSEQTLVFAALSAIIFLLLVALSFVLLRNLLKLYADRRLGVLGSKFRTRMVVGALVLSFAPVILLCFFAYGLMNRSIVKWYSRPVEEVRQNTAEVASMVANYAADDARSEAESIAALPEVDRAFSTGNFSAVLNEFRRHEITLHGGFAFALTSADGAAASANPVNLNAEASFHAPAAWPILRERMPLTHTAQATPFSFEGVSFMPGVAAVGDKGLIVVAIPLPQQFDQTLQRLEHSRNWYVELASQLKQVRRTYVGILLIVTLVVLFAATWLALFVSKLVMRPVSALAEATEEIARGRLDYRVEVAAADELGDLVSNFNRMASELQSNRQQLETSAQQIAQANTQLEQRRRQIETILESIPNGVLSLGPDYRVTHANPAFTRLFARPGQELRPPAIGAKLNDIFDADVVSDLEHLVRKADRMGATTSQMEITTEHARLDVAITVASLRHAHRHLGYVMVFEDLSDLLKAQKQAAWREVARRVAHEIKNPLTPIGLSAERMLRHLERGTPDETSLAVMHGCAQTIAGSVETVRTLVDEFSALARFPTSQPQPANVNNIIENALAMFNGRLDGIRVQTFLASDLPRVMADTEAMKRAIANLVDNAAEATKESLVREIQISTSLLGSKDMVEIVVADSGHGVSREAKEKLFLPYFSTKGRGTGLGLAIVSRIVEDHHGSIRVEENAPVGARFIVEIPVAPETARESAHA